MCFYPPTVSIFIHHSQNFYFCYFILSKGFLGQISVQPHYDYMLPERHHALSSPLAHQWDLVLLLCALAPFECLDQVSLKFLSTKMDLLLALMFTKRVYRLSLQLHHYFSGSRKMAAQLSCSQPRLLCLRALLVLSGRGG